MLLIKYYQCDKINQDNVGEARYTCGGRWK
jgi:hypothetical protein